MKNTTRGLLSIAAVCLTVPAYSQALVREFNFEIERQPLAAALTEISNQTGLQIGYFPETLIENIYIGPLSGRYTADVAIAQLLRPSGLSFERLNDRTIAVTGPDSAKSQRREFSTSERKADREVLPTFVRLANVRLAEEPVADDGDQQIRTAANAGESDRKRLRGTLEEIIVTAQKRAENIQDVPLSIAAITADEIDRRGLVSAEDYLRGMPGVNQQSNPHGQVIVIRGLESSPAFKNDETGASVATYFGETPMTKSGGRAGHSSVDVKLVDIERVEVLRGPQGTAFGSASLAGAVRTIPVAPKLDRFEGKAAAGYSVTSGSGGDNHNLQAVGNFPLIQDRLAIRVAGYRFEESGFYRNIAGSAGAAFDATAVTPYGLEAFATDAEEVGSATFTGGRISALFQASDALRFTLTYLKQTTEVNGWAGSYSSSFPPPSLGTFEQARVQVAPEHVVRGHKLGGNNTDLDLANAVMEYDFGWANLTATFSRVESDPEYSVPIFWAWSQHLQSAFRDNVGEVRLTTRLDGPWNFLAGVFAEDIEEEGSNNNIWYGDPATNHFDPDWPNPNAPRLLRHGRGVSTLKEMSAFGEVSWQFLPDFTLTGGVRAYDYERTSRDNGTIVGPLGGGAPTLAGDASGTTFRGNLSYKPTDNALVYAAWSQGFRLGAPTEGLTAVLCDRNDDGIVDGSTSLTIESTKFVDSDNVDNYELGGKLTLLDRRLMIAAAVYRMEWTDMQVLSNAPGLLGATDGSGCGEPYTTNAGTARTEGVELETNFQVTDAFRVDLGGSWNRAKLTKDVPAQGWFAGDRLPGSPEYNANLGLQYGFKMGASEASVRLDSIYIGPFYGAVLAPGVDGGIPAGDYIKVDASARLALGSTDIDLFVRNLMNADDFTWRGNINIAFPGYDFQGHRLQPRTFGLQISHHFGQP